MPVIVMLNNKMLGFYFKDQPYQSGAVNYMAYGYRRVYDSCFWLGDFATSEIAEQAIKDYFAKSK
jgi:hypothetical protein